MNKLIDWLDHRTGCREILHEALYERVPGGARWRYVWGSTLVFTFVIQMVTGIFLWSAYSPSGQTAWESIYFIQEVMFLGSVVRGMHHFAAQMMIVLLAVHLMQVIIDGAYKAPREINFWLGLILMQIVLGLSLTGYLLPWDQKGYYATQVSTKIMGATPVVGAELQKLVQGGPEYGHHTLTRFFAMHAGILPGLLIFFLVLHIYVFRRHGITVADPDHAPEVAFWPDQVLKDSVACLGVLAVIMLLAIFRGAELSPPANPSEAYAAARPEWYFLFLFRFLKFEEVEHFGLAFGAIYVPGALMTVLVAMPLIAYFKWGHKFNVAFMWVMALLIGGLTGLAWYEDANDPNHQAAIHEAERDAHRVVELASRPSRIPVEGAVTLLREDPFSQGPRLFAKHCSSCHRYNGHNARGRMLTKVDAETKERTVLSPEATDLGKFGSRDWMRAVVLDYSETFKPLRAAAWLPKAIEDGEEYLDLDESEMAQWSADNREVLMKEENKESLDALIEYLASLTGREDLDINEELAAKGETIAMEGTLAVGEIDACANCHDTLADTFEPSEDEYYYPELAGYGSRAWLKAFISNPASGQFYPSKNKMPAYAERMSEEELDLLVRWMTGDYHETHVEPYESYEAEVRQALEAHLKSDGGKADDAEEETEVEKKTASE